jgi:hypothetical protein
MLVFFTTIVFGALMPFAIKFFKSFDEKEKNVESTQYIELKHLNSDKERYSYLHPNFSNE